MKEIYVNLAMSIVAIMLAFVASYYHVYDPNKLYSENGSLLFNFFAVILPAIIPSLMIFFCKTSKNWFYISWAITFVWSSIWLAFYLTD